MYNESSSLKKVCEDLADRHSLLTSRMKSSVRLLAPLRPMLAKRVKPEDVLREMAGDPWVIETKYDGERIQVFFFFGFFGYF